MQKTIYFSRAKRKSLLLIAILFFVFSVAATVFFFFFAGYDTMSGLKFKTTSVCLVLISLFMVIKLAAALNGKDQTAVLLDEHGIVAFTTPVSKAVGLVSWKDIADIRLIREQAGTYISIFPNDQGKFEARIRNRIIRDAFKATKAVIKIGAGEVEDIVKVMSDVLDYRNKYA